MRFIPKKYYTFSELQSRWQCTQNDLKQALIDGDLVASFHMHFGNYVVHIFTPFDDGETDGCYPFELRDWSTGNEARESKTGFYYLILPLRTGAADCDFSFFSETSRLHKEGDICFGVEQRLCVDDVIADGVVKASEVDRVEAMNAENTTVKSEIEKPLGTRERDTLLTIIAALAKAAKININEPGKAALAIEGMTAELGAHASKRAIEDHLKKIPDALETRMK